MPHAAVRLWPISPSNTGRSAAAEASATIFAPASVTTQDCHEQNCRLHPKGTCRPRFAEDTSVEGTAQVLGCPASCPYVWLTSHLGLSAAPLQDVLSFLAELSGSTANKSLRIAMPDCRQILHHHLQQCLAQQSCRTVLCEGCQQDCCAMTQRLSVKTEVACSVVGAWGGHWSRQAVDKEQPQHLAPTLTPVAALLLLCR